MTHSNSFNARTIRGAGRGKTLGTPTINLDLAALPHDVAEGIYACRVEIDHNEYDAVMHYGPRPVFKDSVSCEVHLLDRTIDQPPEHLVVQIIGFIRPVLDFPSVDALKEEIARDIEKARAMLASDAPAPESPHRPA